MPKTINATDYETFEEVEVDLWSEKGGALFRTRPITLAVQEQIADAQRKVTEETPVREDLQAVADLFDLILVSANGSRRKASTVVWKRIEEGLDVRALGGLIEAITDAGRPT